MDDRLNTFARPALDRAAHHRADEEWQHASIRSNQAQILLMNEGRPLCFGEQGDQGPRDVAWMGPPALSVVPPGQPTVFLGLDDDNRPHFAIDTGERFRLDSTPLAGLGVFEDLRGAAAQLTEADLNLIGTARSIFEWHRRHGFCANCGSATEITEAGWKRNCPSCKAEHFPRVDPVAIMLGVSGDYCLLGTGLGFPEQMVSCLAGFIEPGETFEDGARRELLEEAGIVGHEVRYIFGQPWPFPSSLMLGMIIECDKTEPNIDPKEIKAAYWVSKEEVRQMLTQSHPELWCPPSFAIAHQILKVWAEE